MSGRTQGCCTVDCTITDNLASQRLSSAVLMWTVVWLTKCAVVYPSRLLRLSCTPPCATRIRVGVLSTVESHGYCQCDDSTSVASPCFGYVLALSPSTTTTFLRLLLVPPRRSTHVTGGFSADFQFDFLNKIPYRSVPCATSSSK